jgi:predicted DNA-binding transcriptional regulator AlpA
MTMKIKKAAPEREAIRAAVGECLLDKRELAAFLGMTPNAIGAAMCRGQFPLQPLRIGSRLRWRASDVRAWIETQSRGAGR